MLGQQIAIEMGRKRQKRSHSPGPAAMVRQKCSKPWLHTLQLFDAPLAFAYICCAPYAKKNIYIYIDSPTDLHLQSTYQKLPFNQPLVLSRFSVSLLLASYAESTTSASQMLIHISLQGLPPQKKEEKGERMREMGIAQSNPT